MEDNFILLMLDNLLYKQRMSNSYISVFVKNLTIPVRIGLLDFEKKAPQKLEISVEIFAAPSYLYKGGFMDYARVHDFIASWQDQPHTDLLETLLKNVIDFCFDTYTDAKAVTVSISKPDIFDLAQQAGLSAHVTRDCAKAFAPQ